MIFRIGGAPKDDCSKRVRQFPRPMQRYSLLQDNDRHGGDIMQRGKTLDDVAVRWPATDAAHYPEFIDPMPPGYRQFHPRVIDGIVYAERLRP